MRQKCDKKKKIYIQKSDKKDTKKTQKDTK